MGLHRAIALSALLVACCSLVAAYPEFYVASDSNGCFDQPQQAYGGHGAPVNDPSITVTVTDATGAAVTSICPGGKYPIQVAYLEPRLSLLLVGGHGSKLTDASPGCANRKYQSVGATPSTTFDAMLAVPCSNSTDTKANMLITSAQGPDAPFQQAKVTLVVLQGTDPQCASFCGGLGLAAASTATPVANATTDGSTALGDNSIVVPVSGSTADPAAAVQGVAAAASAEGFTYYTKPVIPASSRQLMLYVHGGLMMAAFCLLMPVGMILARHKWMFGSVEGKVSPSWFGAHLFAQLAGIACAIAGVVIAILTFGLKNTPLYPLFAPHQWMGIAVVGMALLQLVLASVRPKLGSKQRRGWTMAHAWFGRLTVAAGIANVFIGTILIHDMKGQPYVNWVVPAAACVGAVMITALLLEAFKVQYQRTHRYNPKTHQMYDVYSGHHITAKRSGADTAAAYAAAGPDAVKRAAPPAAGPGVAAAPLTVGVTADSHSGAPPAPAPAPAGAFPMPSPQEAMFPAVDPEAGLRPARTAEVEDNSAQFFPRVPHAHS